MYTRQGRLKKLWHTPVKMVIGKNRETESEIWILLIYWGMKKLNYVGIDYRMLWQVLDQNSCQTQQGVLFQNQAFFLIYYTIN